jgi:uncharacterized protein YdeI (YjbR/CyaY-like superfamily)
MNPAVDFYFDKADKWKKEVSKLRDIILSTGLQEECKWGVPCYTYNNKNIVLIHDFKDYCAVLFHKGALLQDPEGILIQQTKNVQAARQIRFSSLKEINSLDKKLKEYIYEAIEVEKAGLEVKLKKVDEYEVPQEFEIKLKKDAALKKSFEALTPGRQRAYLLYFAQPKQSKTRESRIEKYYGHILQGKGLND